jgi:rRNA maturation endonuclease Nob1
MKYAKYICKWCKKVLSEKDEFCLDCGPQGQKVMIAHISKKFQ